MGTALTRLDGWKGRQLLALLLALVLGACATAPVTDTSALHQRIRDGELIEPGDRVRLRTTDGATRVFEVTAIDADHVRGPGAEIAIDTIESCRVLPRHPGAVRKTLVTAAAMVALAALVAAYAYIHLTPDFSYDTGSR